MKRHRTISIIIAIFILIPAFAYASFATTATSSFGGRVLSTKIPLVNCYSVGTGPVLLVNNVESLGSAVYSAAGSGQPVASRVAGTVGGLYGAIPFFAKYNFLASATGTVTISSVPKTGDWILGNASIVPSFSTCDLQIGEYQIPFPVRTTSQYNTSH